MTFFTLSQTHRRILLALVYLYKLNRRRVKSGEISKYLGIRMTSVKNMMQNLKILGFVEGFTGAKGGYIPTKKTYTSLGITLPDESVNIPVFVNSKRVNLIIEGMDFLCLPNPNSCLIKIKALGVNKVNIGDEIFVGPTLVNSFMVRGKVVGKDYLHMLVDPKVMWTFPNDRVEECLEPVITVKAQRYDY